MGKKMKNAPVYYAVAQVQFNPILNLDAYVPAIQAKMLEANFPDFKQEFVQQFVFPFNGVEAVQGASPTVTHQARHLFGEEVAGRSLFLLQTNALSFQTTGYDTFETFSGTVLSGLKILRDALPLKYVERIGLRYLDAVQPSTVGKTLRDFLIPEVLGHALLGDGQLQHSISETITTSSAGQLVSRVLIQHGNIGLPMELSGLTLVIAPRFTQHEGLHAIIDTDASITLREGFEISKVESWLATLHREIDKSFRATVTDDALTSWA